MWWEMVLGIVVIFVLVMLMGPVFWSSRLSLREKQDERGNPKSDR